MPPRPVLEQFGKTHLNSEQRENTGHSSVLSIRCCPPSPVLSADSQECHGLPPSSNTQWPKLILLPPVLCGSCFHILYLSYFPRTVIIANPFHVRLMMSALNFLGKRRLTKQLSAEVMDACTQLPLAGEMQTSQMALCAIHKPNGQSPLLANLTAFFNQLFTCFMHDCLICGIIWT